MTEEKVPWINPDMTFKGAVAGIGALLVLVLVGLLAISFVGFFAWYFVLEALELIHSPIVQALFGLFVILAVANVVWQAISND